MVAAPSEAPHLDADEESAKRRQILDGARQVFLDLGFDGASMGEIARVAGVSKGTLYVYFADKHHLFEAIVEQETLEYGKRPSTSLPTAMPRPRCSNSAAPTSRCSAVPAAAPRSAP